MKVLIADDEPLNREVLEAQVSEWGYSAVLAEDGLQALEALRAADPPQLVILDWQMPNLCGDEVCKKARQEFGDQPLHIVLLTGKRVAKEDMVAAIQAGADDYLRKPWDPAELRARLQSGERAVNKQKVLLAQTRWSTRNGARSDVEVVVCRDCQAIRNEKKEWLKDSNRHPADVQERAVFAICPECIEGRMAQIAVDSL